MNNKFDFNTKTTTNKHPKLKAEWAVELSQDLKYIHEMNRRWWEWKYLFPWNWTRAYKAWKYGRLELELAEILAEEIKAEINRDILNKVIDDEIIKIIKNYAENEKKS